MKLVKLEKPNCPACGQVGQVLDSTGVDYEKWDIYGSDKNATKAQEILGELGYFTVPVTVILDNADNVVDHSQGFKPDELHALVEKI